MSKHVDDEDNPTLTTEEILQMRPASEVSPALAEALRRRRGKQKTPTKQLVSLRVDAKVLQAYRSTGKGWQSRINDTLVKHAPRRRSAKAAAPSRRPRASR